MTFAEDDAAAVASKRKEIVTWCETNDIGAEETARRVAEFDASPAAVVPLRPCFLEPDYELFRRYFQPPSLEGVLWEMYRRIAGHRSLIVLPMGGTLPGAIPILVAREYLKQEGFPRRDWDLAMSVWETMDGIAAEQRNAEMKRAEQK